MPRSHAPFGADAVGRNPDDGGDRPDEAASRRFDIGELATLAGVRPSALRYYEREGLLAPAGRAAGRRFYDEQGIRQLAAVFYWQDAGLSLREVARLVDEAGSSVDELKDLATSRIAELDALIEQATRVKSLLAHVLYCTHSRLDACPRYQAHIQERASRIMAGTHVPGPPS